MNAIADGSIRRSAGRTFEKTVICSHKREEPMYETTHHCCYCRRR